MSTQTERYDLATQPLFLRRVEMTMVQFAKVVLTEAHGGQGQPTDAQHALRVDLANGVLADSAGYARRMALAIVSDPNITDQAPYGHDLTDAEIDGAVQATWNALAGVSS